MGKTNYSPDESNKHKETSLFRAVLRRVPSRTPTSLFHYQSIMEMLWECSQSDFPLEKAEKVCEKHAFLPGWWSQGVRVQHVRVVKVQGIFMSEILS